MTSWAFMIHLVYYFIKNNNNIPTVADNLICEARRELSEENIYMEMGRGLNNSHHNHSHQQQQQQQQQAEESGPFLLNIILSWN